LRFVELEGFVFVLRKKPLVVSFIAGSLL